MQKELSTEQLIHILRKQQGRTVICRRTEKQNNHKRECQIKSYHIKTDINGFVLFETDGKGLSVAVDTGSELTRIMTYLLDMQYIQLSYAAEIMELSVF